VVALVTVLIRGGAGKFLVICPLSCSEQWAAELRKWGSVRSSQYHGAAPAKKAAWANLLSGRVDVLVTNYETFVQDAELLASHEWGAVVLDELHRLKSSRTKLYAACLKLKCRRRIGLTGTLMQNNLKELYAVVHFIQPGCFGTAQNFDTNFVAPIKSGLRRDASPMELAHSKLASEALHNRLCVGSGAGGAVYLRRDKSLIAHTLPKKEDSILFCAMTPLQIEVYARVLQLPEFMLLKESVQVCPLHATPRRQCCLASRSDELRATMLRALGSLRKVANSLVRMVDDRELGSKALGPELQARVQQMHLEHNLEVSGKMRVLEQLLREWHDENFKECCFLLPCFYF
jgi:SNF2 family DNA or RNA helicase